MAKKLTYIATHDETGEVIQGTVEELAEALSVRTDRIYIVASTGSKVGYHWSIEKESHFVPENENKLPRDLCVEWEKVTKPFKKASRKAGERSARIS